jgi:putative dimethyl sulfoxide reductase chaperone
MLKELIANRSDMYGFLARLYREEADQELLERMAEMEGPVKEGWPEINEGYRLLKNYLDRRTEKSVFDLATDYAGIFLVAGAKGDCAYPYESIYTSPLRLVMQEARDQVLKLYRENGLEKSPESNEPEDHISCELEFMSYLCGKTVKALKANDKKPALGYLKKQKYFLEEHLGKWAPAFCQDIERIAEADFYKAVARITTGYLHLEQDLIEELIEVVKAG